MSADSPAGSAPGGVPVTSLDEGALARLRELDPDGRHNVLKRVLGAFESSLMRMLSQLTAERHDAHAAVVSALAHTLKSSSASIGALSLSRACADVERRLRAGDETRLRADIEQLLQEGEAALRLVRAMLAQ